MYRTEGTMDASIGPAPMSSPVSWQQPAAGVRDWNLRDGTGEKGSRVVVIDDCGVCEFESNMQTPPTATISPISLKLPPNQSVS